MTPEMSPEDIVKENEGFEIVDPLELDLSEVKEERVLLPPSDNVKLRIRKVTNMANKDNTYRQLNCSFQVVDGIKVGEATKFQNSVLFERVCYYADPDVYAKDFFKRRQHLVALQQLMNAIGQDIKKITINDGFLESMADKVVIANVRQVPNSFIAKDGTPIDTTINTLSRFRAVSPESQV